MADRESVVRAVFGAIEEVNQGLSAQKRVERALDAVLSGEGAELESLDLVNLIAATEEHLERELGEAVPLFDGAEEAEEKGAFRDVGSFVDHVLSLVGEG
jgi:acyl carrier protein